MTHDMKLRPIPFKRIQDGQKSIELRLYDEKRRNVAIGDFIVLTQTESGEKLKAKVVGLYRYGSFKELYAALPLKACGYLAEEVDDASYQDMYAYYTEQEEEKFGVVGIELQTL